MSEMGAAMRKTLMVLLSVSQVLWDFLRQPMAAAGVILVLAAALFGQWYSTTTAHSQMQQVIAVTQTAAAGQSEHAQIVVTLTAVAAPVVMAQATATAQAVQQNANALATFCAGVAATQNLYAAPTPTAVAQGSGTPPPTFSANDCNN